MARAVQRGATKCQPVASSLCGITLWADPSWRFWGLRLMTCRQVTRRPARWASFLRRLARRASDCGDGLRTRHDEPFAVEAVAKHLHHDCAELR